MAKKLNPRRRAEMRARREAIQRNPSTLTDMGDVRTNVGQWDRERLFGSSKGLTRGLLHLEANVPTFPQHKRRKATKQALHVNPADLTYREGAYSAVPKSDAPLPKPKPKRRVGSKIVTVSRKPFGNI